MREIKLHDGRSAKVEPAQFDGKFHVALSMPWHHVLLTPEQACALARALLDEAQKKK